MNNSNNAHYIEIPCQESNCACLAHLCAAIVSSSLRFKRMGENGRAGTCKEGSCSECYMHCVITNGFSRLSDVVLNTF